MYARSVVVIVGLASCAQASSDRTGSDAAVHHDARATGDSAGGSDANSGIDGSFRDAPPSAAAALALTEVTLAGTEFIEIANPTGATVDLSTYYLADNGNYFKLPAGTPTLTTGDFIAKFAAGSTIASHGVQTIAIGTAVAFNTAYGVTPTYSLSDGTITTVVKQGTPSLTDTGEVIVLFQWDGTAPLVKDVDIMIAGAPSSGNGLTPSKSGYTQLTASYATDANTIASQASAPPSGKSTKRILAEAGHETQNGAGNGINGDDETSEDTGTTWDTTATFSAPTPGTSPVN